MRLFEQIQAHVAQHCQDGRAIVLADTAIIFPHYHVQSPMQPIFNAAMRTDGMGKRLGVGGDGVDRIARQTPPFRAGKDSADGE